MNFTRHKVKQGTIGWHWLRAGKVGSSSLKYLMGSKGAQAALLASMRAGLEARGPRPSQAEWDQPEATDGDMPALRWGHKHEPAALARVEMDMGDDFERSPVISPHVTGAFMVSLDALTKDLEPVEVKSPYNPEVHMRTLANGMPIEHKAQLQAGMICTGAKRGLFISFDPRQDAPKDLHVQWIPRDEAYCQEALRRLRAMSDHLNGKTVYEPQEPWGSFQYNALNDAPPKLFG